MSKIMAKFAGLPLWPGRGGETRLPLQGDFWRLWFAGLILNSVRWIETIAIAIFTYRETHSAFLVAFISMLRLLPMGLFGAFLGALTDRLDRRIGLILIVLVSLCTSVTLAVLAWTGLIQVWHLAVATFIGGIGWAADYPVRRILIADVVGRYRLAAAMSIEVAGSQISRTAGPALGGLLFATLGLHGCFILEAALCLAALSCAITLRHRDAPHPASTASSMFAQVVDGMKAARHDAKLRGALLITILFNVFGWPCTSMIPVIGQDHLRLDAAGIGILASMEGIGALLGTTLIGIASRPQQYGAIYLTGTIVSGLALFAFALAPDAVSAGTALTIAGIAGAGFTIMQATMIQLLAPAEMRGRILGLLAVCIGVAPIGYILLGLLANLIGANAAVMAMDGTGLVVLALLHRQWLPLLRKDALG